MNKAVMSLLSAGLAALVACEDLARAVEFWEGKVLKIVLAKKVCSVYTQRYKQFCTIKIKGANKNE